MQNMSNVAILLTYQFFWGSFPRVVSDRLSSYDSRGFVLSWLRIPPASCSNHGRDGAKPLSET